MNFKSIIFLPMCTLIISACGNFGNGKSAEEELSKAYSDGLFEEIEKNYPSPKLENYIVNGKLDNFQFDAAVIRNLEQKLKISSASCEAAKKIAKAYEEDLFQSEKVQKWKNDSTCAVSRELKNQLNSRQAEQIENLNKLNYRYNKLANDIYEFTN